MGILDTLTVLLPKGKQPAGGTSFTPTYRPSAPRLVIPSYQNHLNDLYDTRGITDSKRLLNDLLRHDPDVSSAVHSYLTVCSAAPMMIEAYDPAGELSPDGIVMGRQLVELLTTETDYTIGANTKPALSQMNDELRYMVLLRGGIGAELIFDKKQQPSSFRLVDTSTLIWDETLPGRYAPTQRPVGTGNFINLDIPTFFLARHFQNPTDMFNYSTFVSSINTIAARNLVINELYRVMQLTGFPRLDIEVNEDTLLKHAPPSLKNEPDQQRSYVKARLAELQGAFDGLRSDQAFVHTDAVIAKIMNEKNPAVGLNVDSIIKTLDGQNQAALKVMPAVVGKGENSQTSAVESRLFAMSADALNRTLANLWSQALTLGVRLNGFQGKIVVRFAPVELRPELELEPQKVMRASRLKDDLSLGIISDSEYSMQVHGRPPLASAPVLSGTNFLQSMQDSAAIVDASSISPNADPLGRSLVPSGSKSVKSNGIQSGGGNKAKGQPSK